MSFLRPLSDKSHCGEKPSRRHFSGIRNCIIPKVQIGLLFFAAGLLVCSAVPEAAPVSEQAHLQSKWHPQFQFALAFCIAAVAIALMLRYLQIATRLKHETERLNEELALRKEREEQVRKLFRAVECCSASIIITDRQGNIEYVNPKFCAQTGYSPEEVRGKNPRLLKFSVIPSGSFQDLWTTIGAGREWHGEFHNQKKDGELYWELASISPIINESSEITHFVAIKEDITERKRTEQLIRERKAELRESNRKLQQSLAEVKELSGLLPICAWCKKIKDGAEYWHRVEDYISRNTKAHFTHGICPDCYQHTLNQYQTSNSKQ